MLKNREKHEEYESRSYRVKSMGRKITWIRRSNRERLRVKGRKRKRTRISGKINELKSRRSDGWMVQAGNRKI